MGGSVSGDNVIPRKGKDPVMRITHRYHFSSALKRMLVIASYNLPGSTNPTYIATMKGAPETIRGMVISRLFAKHDTISFATYQGEVAFFFQQLATVPENYNDSYLELSRQGARVLALAWKELGRLTPQEARDLKREDLEVDLIFAGFVTISCPLKPDSRHVIKEILNASHSVSIRTRMLALTPRAKRPDRPGQILIRH